MATSKTVSKKARATKAVKSTKPSIVAKPDTATIDKAIASAKPAPRIIKFYVPTILANKASGYGEFDGKGSITAHKASLTMAIMLMANAITLGGASKDRIDSANGNAKLLKKAMGRAYDHWAGKSWIEGGKVTANGLNELKARLEGKHGGNWYHANLKNAAILLDTVTKGGAPKLDDRQYPKFIERVIVC